MGKVRGYVHVNPGLISPFEIYRKLYFVSIFVKRLLKGGKPLYITEGPGFDPRWRRTLEQGISHTVKLTLLVIIQERVSVLYTWRVKEPEDLLKRGR